MHLNNSNGSRQELQEYWALQAVDPKCDTFLVFKELHFGQTAECAEKNETFLLSVVGGGGAIP